MNDVCRMANAKLVACIGEGTTEPLVEILIVPDGPVTSISGEFVVDAESWALIEEAFREHGTRIPIDYEHQTLGGEYASPDGKAPAAGWITALRYEKGRGIIALVEWTERARQMIRAQEYRYLSPVLVVRKADRKAIGLHSAGLTNKPAIQRMEALAAKQGSFREKTTMADEPGTTTSPDPGMLVAEIKALLGIEVENDTDVLEVLRAIRDWAKTQKGEGSEGEDQGGGPEGSAVASKAVLAAIGVQEGASESEAVVAINSLKQGSGGLATIRKELDVVKGELADRQAEEALRPFIDANKINPKDEKDLEVCRRLAREDPQLFAHMMAQRQPYAEPGRTVSPPGTRAGDSREAIIANAAKEYREGGDQGRLTELQSFVNTALRDAGKKRLTGDEEDQLLAA